MEGSEYPDFERVPLPGGCWRFRALRPNWKNKERIRHPSETSLVAAHGVIPAGQYPNIDAEIENIGREVVNFREIKQRLTANEKPLEKPYKFVPCLAQLIRPWNSPPDPLIQQPSIPMPLPKPVPDRRDWRGRLPSDSIGVRILLANDSESRKAVSWPLVPYEEFGNFSIDGNLCSEYDDDPLYKIEPSQAIINGEVKDPVREIRSFSDRTAPITLLMVRFPYLLDLFPKHRGHLAVAGGSMTRLFFPQHSQDGSGYPVDVDIFFYGLISKSPSEKAVQEAEARANVILRDCVATLCVLSPNYVRVEHKEYVTNVYVVHPDPLQNGFSSEVCYQFIKRLYPTKDSIIGGFDLGPSMLLYDGDNIYGTEMGAWSIAKRALVVDTTRRSLTFERRIKKLHYLGFSVIFPGLRQSTVDSWNMDPDFDEQNVYNKIEQLLRSLNIVPSSENPSSDGYHRAISGMFSEDMFERRLPPICVGDLRINIRKGLLWTGAKGFDRKPYDGTHWVAKTSDYNDQYIADFRIDAVASSALRMNNLDAVFTYFVRSREHDYVGDDGADAITYDEACLAFDDLVANPKVVSDPFYRHRVETFLLNYGVKESNPRRVAGLFGEFGPAIREIYENRLNTDGNQFIGRVVTIMEERMKVNAIKCEERLRGLKWISQEPGRQWTSSIKPIRERPVDFYGVRFYTPFPIGIPVDIESTVRLIWYSGRTDTFHDGKAISTRNQGNVISTLPRDVLRLMLRYLARAYVHNIQMKPAPVQTQIPGMLRAPMPSPPIIHGPTIYPMQPQLPAIPNPLAAALTPAVQAYPLPVPQPAVQIGDILARIRRVNAQEVQAPVAAPLQQFPPMHQVQPLPALPTVPMAYHPPPVVQVAAPALPPPISPVDLTVLLQSLAPILNKK